MLQTDMAKHVARAKQMRQRIAQLRRPTSQVLENCGKKRVGKLER